MRHDYVITSEQAILQTGDLLSPNPLFRMPTTSIRILIQFQLLHRLILEFFIGEVEYNASSGSSSEKGDTYRNYIAYSLVRAENVVFMLYF